MKFVKPSIIALGTIIASLPTSFVVDAWNMGPKYYYLSVPTSLQVSSSMNRILDRERMMAQRMLGMVDDIIVDHRKPQQMQQIVRYRPSHQRYELIDNNERFELKVDVPGIKEEDLVINVDSDRRLIIEGQRMVESENSKSTSKFSKTFSFDKTVEVDKFAASLNNGVLVVSAPKDLTKLEANIRKIPITTAAIADTNIVDDVAKVEEKANTNDILTGKDDDTEEQNEEGVEDNKLEVSTDTDTLDLDFPNAESN